jgi:sodium/hydrogen exchanger 10/11
MLGAILAHTDIVEIARMFRGQEAPKRLHELQKGESIINNAICWVTYTVAKKYVDGLYSSVLAAVGEYLLSIFLGSLLGLFFGFIVSFWIRKIMNDEVLIVNITIMSSFLTYFIAENFPFYNLPVSGVTAVITLGLYFAAMGKTTYSS